MKTSASTKHLMAAMLQASGKLGVVALNSLNPHLKTQYADLGSVLSTVKPALTQAGLVVMQSPAHANENGQYLCGCTTRIAHPETDEWVETTILLPLSKVDPQGAGGAISYAKRYSLISLLAVYASNEDDDAHAASEGKPLATVSDAQAAQVAQLITETKTERSAFLTHFKVEKIHDLTLEQYSKAVSLLTTKLQKLGAKQ